MDPELDNAVRRIRFGDMVNAYFPFINLDAFGAAYPEDLLRRIHIKLQDTVRRRPVDDVRHKETILSEAWLDVDVVESLSPGYILNIFEDHADQTTHRNKQKNYYGALISKSDKHLVQQDQPNYFLDDLSVVFKRGGGQHDPWDTTDVVDSDSRSEALDQLESHAARHFYFQHRTGLFMLFVNGGEFRVIRWDRSGCIVTEALNYVESADHTKKLLQFLYAYSQATPEQRGIDTTATRLSKDSCGWQWMQKLAVAHAKDLDCADDTELDSVPEGFVVKATGDASASPLFAANVLADDPTATMGFADLSSLVDTSALVAPVFKYVRDLFRESVSEAWTYYRLKVCGRDYLVGKPTFSRQGMVGRGTRGYVALEWKTQRFVFLKDVWRYSRWGIDRTEGETLNILNDADVPFVPTLVCDEDVHGGKQVTHASEHSAPGTKKDRPIAPLPALSPSATPQDDPTPTASTPPMGQKPFAAEGDGSGKDLKRPRPETTTAVEPSHKNRSSCRRFTHYRIVVAEVCMPSSAFTSGMQLVRVLWTCITGHRCAAKRCNMLHCDISTGNIFILPMVHVLASKRSTKGEKKPRVLWCGILGDWELAKKCPDAHEMSQSGRRLKQRAGTWYFMSVYAVNNPSTPISIADELESFFHVLLYLAIRYLRSTLRSRGPGIFIDAYFDSWGKDGDGTLMCPIVKGNVVTYYGRLAFNRKPIAFLPDPQHPNSESDEHDEPVVDASHPPSPLNHLILVLLDHFKAHYAVRSYNEECKVRNEARKMRKLNPPEPPRDSNIDTATPNTADADKESDAQAELDWLLSMREFFGGRPRRTPPEDIKVVLGRAPPEPPEPSAEEQAKSARLATHAYVEDLFFSLIGGRVLWPKKDHVGDQLEGFVYPGYSRFGVGNSTTSSDEEGDGEESVISDWDD